MAHANNPEADALLDKEFPVLDHGFVRLVDYMGGDDRIVQSARVSYGKGTKTVRQDKGLIDYLMRHQHTSPFEQVILTFHLKMPIFVARQWVRHRTARMNEISGRYSVMTDEFYVPDPEHIHRQSQDNKQGRDESLPLPEKEAEKVRSRMEELNKKAYELYQSILDEGVSRELARVNLPISLYTEFYWQMDLRNLLHFLHLRLGKHAQLEIRLYAETMGKIVKTVTPFAYEAFERHVLFGRQFSSLEIQAIRDKLAGKEPDLTERQMGEFLEKLEV